MCARLERRGVRNSPSSWLCRATCQTPLLGAGLSQGTVLPTVGKPGPGDIHNRPSVQGGAAKSGSVFEPFELTHAAKKLAGKVMHLVCLFISYLLTPLLLDIFRLSALDKDKCQTLFFLWPLETGICDAFARKQGTSDLLPKVINFTESN